MRLGVLMLALGVSQAMAGEPGANLAMRVKEELDVLRQDVPTRQVDIRSLREDGICFQSNVHFRAIATMLSNGWQEVWSDLPEVLSNANDRLIVLAASIKPSESDFLSKIDALADLVLSNKVSRSELTWYWSEYALTDHHSASALIRRYAEPSVSNLVLKLDAANCLDGHNKTAIFSGEEKSDYEDAVHDGLIGPCN